MIADRFQPLPLLNGKLATTAVLLSHPTCEASIHIILKWMQLILLVNGEADKGDDVG